MNKPANTPSTIPLASALWRVELLGQVRATSGGREVTQFGSRKIVALLARLALYPKRAHGREELVDLLWPDADLDTGRNRLRQALFALRRLLEPPGAPELLQVDRQSVRLLPHAFSCDALDFEAHVRAKEWAAARALHVGELMPGHYDEWIEEERQRLAALADRIPPHAPSSDRLAATSTAPQPASASASASAPASSSEHPSAAPQPSTSPLPPTLPAYVARFFGREQDMVALSQLLAEHRLVTLTGPGGSGKTRLAAEVARRACAPAAAAPAVRPTGANEPAAPDLPKGTPFDLVAFVALADSRRSHEIPARLRAALRLPEGPGDALEPVRLYLQGKRALLVLDNFEQLVGEGGAGLLEALLQEHPGLHMLVSSRRLLDAEGERRFEVPPLPLPADDDDLPTAAANPSVALFVDRAQAARTGFHLNARNRTDVLALCTALQGVPLAIELAASRAHAMSVADMRAQMDTRLQGRYSQLARRGPRAARAPRHASLDAAIDWSWQMLSPLDQRCLAALSVFRDGFTAEAAAAVWQQPAADEVLARLVADSLVRTEAAAAGPMRYHLFEMVREFVAERLDSAERPALRQRHRNWCLQRARDPAVVLPLADVPNLQEALRSALDDGQPLQTLSLALATESHWERRGVPPEVRAVWLDALEAVQAGGQVRGPGSPNGNPQGNPADSATVHAARCLFARRLYETGDAATAVVLAEEAVATAGSDPAMRARALAVQLRLRWKSRPRSDDGMSEALRGALALTDGSDNLHTRAELLNLLGEVMVLGRQDADAALPFYDEALALFEALGEDRLAWDVRMGQGICAQVQRRFDDAVAMHTAVARAAERLDDQLLLIDACNNLAVACNYARRWHDAVRHGRRQLQLATRQYSRYMQVMALWNLARPLARNHQPEAAATALAASAHEWLRHFGPLAPRDQRYVTRVRRLVQRQVGVTQTTTLWARAEGLSLGDAVNAVLDEDGVSADRA